MDINATFIGQIVVFLIMLWFITKVVVPMIAKPINERYAKIADGLAAADAGQKQLQQASASADQIVREARERAKQVDEQAQRRSAETIEAAKQAALAEGARLLAAAQAEVGNESVRASEALRRQFGSLVVKAASTLVEHEVDPATHAKLLERLTDDIARG
ncbi:MAG TPA: F0F1 ATP synthase subunit B [Steroidobacteraceae bacterium]|jgi:F-type H+-transporting ATPase subunit b|nr:F0F1 ATP synthase subunit B [Steroidobacteraceae bacterium]